MSFASNARAEMARELCMEKCCARAELAAALLCSGGISYRFGSEPGYALSITAAEAAVVRHYFQLLKRHFGVGAQILTLRSNSLNGLTRYRLNIPEEASMELMRAAGLYDPNAPFGIAQTPSPDILGFSCCKKTFVKSAFMVCGGIANPDIEYHIEIASPNEEFTETVIELLKYFEIHAKKTCRKSKSVVYLKKGDDVSDMLTLMGASASALKLQGVRVRKEVSNRVNRQMNCDSAHINRVMDASLAQIEDIRYIRDKIGLEGLDPKLREVAQARLNNAATSLAGLGEMLTPPIGKSGVNARLSRLTRLARELRAAESGNDAEPTKKQGSRGNGKKGDPV